MRKLKTKPFIWSGWIKPTNQTIETVTVFSGNFLMELRLSNSLKITSFEKLKERLHAYMQSHDGKIPHVIRVNRRQYREYEVLLLKSVYGNNIETLSFHGIPLLLHMSLFKGFDTLCKK